MKFYTPLLILQLLCSISFAEEETALLEILAKAREHLPKNEKILELEELQHEGSTVAYFFTVGTEKKIRENGLVVTTELQAATSVSREEIEPFRYSPPKKMKVTKRENQQYNMPVVKPDTSLYK